VHYYCELCEHIYETPGEAAYCCKPEAQPIEDDKVVYCLHCKGEGCAKCGNQGIMRAASWAWRESLKIQIAEVDAEIARTLNVQANLF
jgi:hypothetical protein